MDHVSLYNILIVGDSRLRYLEPRLNATSLNLQFTVRVLPGARLSNIALSATAALSYAKVYHLVIIAGGINDMSRLAYLPTKHALPRYGNFNDLVNHTLETLREGMHKIRSIADAPVILATLAGMDFSAYSPNYADLLHPLQKSFNKAVIEVNGQIRGINRLASLDTINLAYPIHRCKGKGGRYATQFSYLHDGLHPTEELLNKWVDAILTFCAEFFPSVVHVQSRFHLG